MQNPRVEKIIRKLIPLPICGAVLFFVCYVRAAMNYPETGSVGFSMLKTYWCDLSREFVYNGRVNPARPWALLSMFIGLATIALFWFLVPYLFRERTKLKWATRVIGISSICVSALVTVPHLHHSAIFFGSALAIIAVVLVLRGLWSNSEKSLCFLGSVCLLLWTADLTWLKYSIHQRRLNCVKSTST